MYNLNEEIIDIVKTYNTQQYSDVDIIKKKDDGAQEYKSFLYIRIKNHNKILNNLDEIDEYINDIKLLRYRNEKIKNKYINDLNEIRNDFIKFNREIKLKILLNNEKFKSETGKLAINYLHLAC